MIKHISYLIRHKQPVILKYSHNQSHSLTTVSRAFYPENEILAEELHSIIGRATTSFRDNPIDVLRGAFDIASFTMDAVLSINL